MEKKVVTVPDIEPLTISWKRGKKIHQYGIDGKYIRSFDSISEAGKELSIKGGGLSKCLRGLTKSCHGFQWRYSE